ncbi:antibiotic biosynthesis monooxygenase [Muricauda sp. SCSIO 64092]|uniref:putative quinol monooxygenase n=1 Tax=Allomuricauda sp. SCSIO 64092 TaxID=2908842 RepID=UPI001FF278FA|nr:antibiotic biosynthesis monooxygenase [Muricauda sp. SCSIO 64092]UOY06162.1 antibiotic biosynthesis monooxygenase [Muricauda sp. SCSIO 64092]
MLIRIVKLSFKAENISSFELLFEETKEKIRSFEGCMHLELYQDLENPTTFFTYSKWEDECYLDLYRQSDFFKTVWSRTKKLFQDKPEAWSVTQLASLA